MLKNILIALVVIVLLFLVFAATRPNSFHVERSTTVGAAPDVVLSTIADFHQFGSWSPWEKLDPQMTKTFEGTPGTVGSSYAWSGNKQVGEGKMTITDVQPDHVAMRLEFVKPFRSTNTTTFTAVPEGTNTKLTWSMDGTNNFMSKVMGIFMPMDKMIGPDFEKGLAAIKPVVESAAAQTAPGATGATIGAQ